jgi:hypothetical protein
MTLLCHGCAAVGNRKQPPSPISSHFRISDSDEEIGMPIGACDRCQRWFVVEDERSPQRTCPVCFHPMRLTASGEALDHVRRQADRARPPESSEAAGSAALLGEALGQRLLAVVAEAAAICSEAELCREEARALRQRTAQARRDRQAARPQAAPPLLPESWTPRLET